MATLGDLMMNQQSLEMTLLENGGELTPEIESALDLNASNMAAKIDGYHRLITSMEFGDAEIDKEIKRLQALKKTKANAQKRLKEYLMMRMREFDIRSIDGVTCKVFRRATAPALKIEDEAALLGGYAFAMEEVSKMFPDWVKVDISIDRERLKAMAKEGVLMAGVSLEKGETIQFK